MYRFKFIDSGEVWEMDDEQYKSRQSHWYRSMLKNMKWYRHYFRENCQTVSQVMIYAGGLPDVPDDLEMINPLDAVACICLTDENVFWYDVANGFKYYCNEREGRKNG